MKIVQYLIECGACGLLRDNDGCTALHRAAEGGHLEVCQLLKLHFPQLLMISDVRERLPKDCSNILPLKQLLTTKQ